MKVSIKYYDDDSLAPEEIIARAKRQYGNFAKVDVFPDSSDPYSLMYFAIQELLTKDQIDSYFNDGALYESNMEILKTKVSEVFASALKQVIEDNEERLE